MSLESEFKGAEALKRAPCIEIKNVRHDGRDGWCLGINYLSTAQPVLEQLREGRVRLVVEMSELAANDLRNAFSLPLVPAAVDASEAIVRATHALAGATIELTSLIREINAERKEQTR